MGYINIKNMLILLPILFQTIEIGKFHSNNHSFPKPLFRKFCETIKMQTVKGMFDQSQRWESAEDKLSCYCH